MLHIDLTVQQNSQYIRLAIWMFIALLMGQAQSLHSQSFSKESAEFFGTHEGFSRYYYQGEYYLVDDNQDVAHRMSQFKTVGDFSHDVAIVKSDDGQYGLINKELKTVLDPKWSAIKAITYNYVAVASHTGKYIEEDRGRGIQSYPEMVWQLVDLRNQVLFSQLEFSDLTAVYGEVRAKTTDGEEVAINLNKINVGYTDPLMKAVSYLQR